MDRMALVLIDNECDSDATPFICDWRGKQARGSGYTRSLPTRVNARTFVMYR